MAAMTRTSTWNRLPGANRLNLTVLQHPQHLGLGLEAHVADLVEEDRAAVGLHELADLAPVGAGERALLVTEELGLDQLLGDRRRVDPDELADGPDPKGGGVAAPPALCRCRTRPRS